MAPALAATFLSSFFAAPSMAQIEEVIVTAQKRAESVQDIGIAVTAVSGEDMRANNIVEPRDLFQRMPNVSVQSNSSAGQLQLSIRGVSFATFSPIGVQPIMVFQDEVVLNSPQVAGLFIFDAERVEVLRGPQNTLYGRNTTGGAVNFIANKPEIGGGTQGYADVSVGNYDSVDINAAIGGELGDQAAFRLAVQSLSTDGYWDNLNIPGDRLGERDQNLLRGQIVWEPSDDVSWLFNLHGGISEGGQRPIKAHGLNAAGGGPCDDLDIDDHSSTCVSPFDGLTPNGNTDEAYSELRNDIDDIEAFGGSVRYDRQFDGFSFMSLTAYEENEYDHWEENDGLLDVPFVLFRQKSETEQWTQEFRFTSDDDDAMRWIAGAYILLEKAELRTAVPIFASFADNSKLDQDTEMYSVFGQIETDVSDRLTVIAGLRYVNEEKEGDAMAQFSSGLDVLDINNPDNFLFEQLAAFRVGEVAGSSFSESWDQWGGKLGIEFQANDDTLWYAHISRGEKGGQFTDAPDSIIQGIFSTPAEPEEVIAYEAGLKATWADNRLQTNVALFFNDYTNQHVQITIPTPSGGVASTVVNAAESETYGLEFDAIFAPGNGWQLELAIGLLNTEIKKDSVGAFTGGAASIQEGRNLSNSPELTANLNLTKDFELANGNILTANLNARYTDEREFNLVDTPETRAFTTDPAYTLLNAFIAYRFGAEQQYKVSAWGKNLTDELYFNHIQEFGIGSTIGFASNPRQYGVTVGIDF